MPETGPLIVQSDRTLMLEVAHPRYEACRDFLAVFAEIVKSPEFVHTYKITPLSLWNAAAMNIPLDDIIKGLYSLSRYEPPDVVISDIKEWYGIYGKLVLEKKSHENLQLTVSDPIILNRLSQDKSVDKFFMAKTETGFLINHNDRGELKQALIKIGYPVKDLCGYVNGDPIYLSLRDADIDNRLFILRDYQKEAIDIFFQSGRASGGSGVIVLPCGSGKTIIGLGIISKVLNYTLIITTNNVSVHQWRDELLSKTTFAIENIGEFTGIKKEIKPITITTYQMLTHRRSKNEEMPYLDIFTNHNWGLIIYDEVHLLPAPVFRATTSIQAKRRLGLTATLIREDRKEDDVFALIGPKRYDIPWKTLEHKGYIAQAACIEYRICLPQAEEIEYAHADKRSRFRIAAENSRKNAIVEELITNHYNDKILIIGQYITQLEKIASLMNIPLITGKMKHLEREKLYNSFKKGGVNVLVVSKVANFAVDLPDANVMIQVSGTFGSRQEEAQRLGRILRPKDKSSYFYTLVSKSTDEQSFGVNRQLFLIEQGYKYQIRYYE
ncbi:MAG: helicase-associated domain-containing protein [Desulfobacterales bacterium]|nr:helicase-associated domain-containing protein [Desulfobacterales bacterium]MBF0395978.1 helicase-associated domain-containing protein [Desulfobacterales bacterium]